MQLTDEQRSIIAAPLSHARITAVAGSGKTTTLAHRLLHLMEAGQDPRRLLVLMFNRSAKTDFEERLACLNQGRFPRLPEIRTYHAMGLRLYRHFMKQGLLPEYRDPVLTEQEVHWQLWLRIQQLATNAQSRDLRNQKKELTELAATLLEHSKTSLKPLPELFEQLGIRPDLGFLREAVLDFESWRLHARRLSFADMLHAPVQLMKQRPELAASVSNRMDMVLVDEYQDTNEVQHTLLRLIAGTRAHVTVVGDPDQTIYEFRGASPDFILSRFHDDFTGPGEQALTFSFRYGPEVARLSNALIHHNRGRKDQVCRAHPGNPQTQVVPIATMDAAHTLVRELRKRCRDPNDLPSCAILFRVWSQAVSVELACLEAAIPYQIDEGKGALNDANVAQLQSLLEVATGEWDNWSLEKRGGKLSGLLKFPHVGLKEEALQQLAQSTASRELTIGDALLDAMPGSLHGLQQYKIKRLARNLNQLIQLRKDSAGLLNWYCQESELRKGLLDTALTREHGEERWNIVQQTIRYLGSLSLSPQAALSHLADLRERSITNGYQQGVLLTTIHRAKGLEWDHVFLPGLSERYLPYKNREADRQEASIIESERRLLYVAMTRCRQSLTLLFPPQPTAGKELSTDPDDKPSRFLFEMGLLENKAPPKRRRHPFLFDT